MPFDASGLDTTTRLGCPGGEAPSGRRTLGTAVVHLIFSFVPNALTNPIFTKFADFGKFRSKTFFNSY